MGKKKILVVDDDLQLLSMLQDALMEAGYRPGTADNGRIATEILAEKPFDLVLSDIKMPEMDGIKLLGHIKKHYPDTKVILMTGRSNTYDIADALALGAEDFITKPFDIEKLLVTLETALRGGEDKIQWDE